MLRLVPTSCWPLSFVLLHIFAADLHQKRLHQTSSIQCKAVKDEREIHFSGGFFSPHSEPVPVPGPAQLPGPPGPVGDGLHGGLGWYCASLSLFIHPSAPDRSFLHGTQPGKAEPLNMNQPPRSNDVSSAESQAP